MRIEQIAQIDLEILERLIKRVSFFLKINGIEHVYGQIRQMILEELDYTHEADAMVLIANNLKDEKGIIIPKVHSSISSSTILVTTFVHGVKITDIQQLDSWHLDRKELAERLILVYCKMILEHGVYHADPHPGNILVTQEGDIVLLDFGAVAHMNESMRKEIPVLVQAIVQQDADKIVHSLRRMGFVGNDDASHQVAHKLINALSNFLQHEISIDNFNLKEIKFNDIKGSSVDQLRKEIGIRELTRVIHVPKDWILLDRTLQLLIGTSHTLAPEVNPIEIIKPYMKSLLKSGGGLRKLILDSIKKQLTALLTLPGELQRFLSKANAGELKMNQTTDGKLVQTGRLVVLSILLIATIFLYKETENQSYEYASIGLLIFIIVNLWKTRKR